MAHVYSSVSVTVLLLAFFGIARVQAQQPLAEIGGWPSGALTLLVGAWLSIQCLSESKYDVLPTILFARILHRITALRRLLTSDIPFGSLTKEVVLTPIEYSGMHHSGMGFPDSAIKRSKIQAQLSLFHLPTDGMHKR